MSSPPTRIVPSVGSSSFSSVRPDRRLAAAALADQPQRLAAADARTTRRRPRRPGRRRVENTPLWIGKCFLRSVTSSKLRASARRSCRAPQQLVGMPAGDPVAGPMLLERRQPRRGTGRSPGRSAARSCSPAGRLNSDGTMPLISFSRVRRRRARRVVEMRDRAQQALGVGMAGIVEQLVGRRPPRPCGRHTSPRRGRRSRRPRPCRG